MADDLRTRRAPGHGPLAAVLGLALAGPAAALGPQAPFTPPAALAGATTAHAAPAATAAATEPATSAAAAAGSAPPRLAGVRLHHHPMALLDGRWLRLGDDVRGARLVAIHARGVSLRQADGHQIELAWNRLHPADPAPLDPKSPP